MTLILLNGSFCIVALAIGFMAGWWMFARRGDAKGTPDVERAMMAAGQIHDLTSRVAQDVGAHSVTVEQISDELTALTGGTSSEGAAVAEAIGKIVTANTLLQGQLKRAEEKLEEQAREIADHRTAASTDSLTGLANRRAFDEALRQRFAEWKRNGTSFSLMIFDVDHFKKFNDTHGHLAGDEVLRTVGAAINQITRDMDIPCRYGGEEFAVIMPATKTDDAKRAVERARKAIEAMVVPFEGKQLKVTASVGLAEVAAPDDPAHLIRRADDALYASKEAGRNNGHYHDGKTCVPITPGTKARPGAAEKGAPDVKLLQKITKPGPFEEEVHRRVLESERFNVPLSLMTVAVKDFERHAAERGQAVCKAILDAVAQLLKSTIREMDLLSWNGRDAFRIMLPGSTKAEAELVSRRIESSLAKVAVPVGQETIDVSVSIGFAELEPGQRTEELIERADPRAARSAASAEPVSL